MDLERTIYERNTYQEALTKAENAGSATEGDKQKVQAELKKVRSSKLYTLLATADIELGSGL